MHFVEPKQYQSIYSEELNTYLIYNHVGLQNSDYEQKGMNVSTIEMHEIAQLFNHIRI